MLCQLLAIASCVLAAGVAEDVWDADDTEVKFAQLDQVPYEHETLDLDNRILHCPPGSNVQKETIHDEAEHIKVNFIINTCVFSVIITTGLLANFFLLSVLQHLLMCPMAMATKAEIVACCAYLFTLIPLYPVANTYAYTGHFKQYEYAKPYVKTFFMACLEITEFLMIWTFVWLNRVRKRFIAPPSLWRVKPEDVKEKIKTDTERLESYVSTSVRDEIRLAVVTCVIIHLPKFFDSTVQVDNDPCNPESTVVLRVPNTLGQNTYYILMYKLIALCTCQYLLPLGFLIYFTYATHRALRPSERPDGDSKEKVLREKSRTDDGLTVELDWRVLFFCVCYVPYMFYKMAIYIQYIVPTNNHGYFEVDAVFELMTRTLITLHAAYAPFGCYIKLYKAFQQKAKEVYWDKYVNKYRAVQRKRQLEKDFKLFEERFNNELAGEYEKKDVGIYPAKPSINKTHSAPEMTRY